jgi:hypothetical protein
MAVSKYVGQAPPEFCVRNALDTVVKFKVWTRSDPDDGIRFTWAGGPNVVEVETTWNHEKDTMGAEELAHSILFDVEDPPYRDALAEVLARLATYFRQSSPCVAAEWELAGESPTLTLWVTGECPPIDGNLTERISSPNPGPPQWRGPGVDPYALERQHCMRNFGNKSKFDHGVARPDFHVDEGDSWRLPSKSTILANTLGWGDPKYARHFLGFCKLRRCNVLVGAVSEEYRYGEIPEWVSVNSRSRLGVIDMLRPGADVTDFPSVGVADYVKLDFRCPQFAYHVERMNYNPIVQIIVVLHDMPDEIPRAVGETGRSELHRRQFEMVAQTCHTEHVRKPLLFRVAFPGWASYLHRHGVYVSPTVEDCLTDLGVVLDVYMRGGDVQHGVATVEEVADGVGDLSLE